MKKKGILTAVLLFGVSAVLSGCSTFDAGAYTKAVLDVSYKNETESYIDLTEATPEEAESVFQNNLDATMEEFKSMKLPDELEKQYRELFESIVKQVKYTVGEAKEEEDGSFSVEVAVEPVTLFDDTYTAFQKRAEEYAAGITDSVMKGETMPTDEEIQNEVYRLYYEILKADLDAGIKYGKAEKVTVHVEKTEDGVYEIKGEDLKALDGKLISQKEMSKAQQENEDTGKAENLETEKK